MSPKTICITGATGFLGSAVTTALLERGHTLRLVVRSSEKGESALKRLNVQQRARAEYSIVPDLQAPGALDNAFKGVNHVFHIASPMPGNSDDVETGYVGPAVGMTLAVLSTAKLHDSIQFVVVTSSMMALIDPLAWLCRQMDIRPYSHLPQYDVLHLAGPELGGPVLKYGISKIRSLQAVREFLQTAKPHFKIVTLQPALVIGHDPSWSPPCPKNVANQMLLGGIFQTPSMPPSFVSIGDVARAHVLAIESPSVETGDEFVIHGPTTSWSEIHDFVKVEHPEICDMVTQVGGTDWAWTAEVTNTEEKLGLRCESVNKAISEALQQHLCPVGTVM